MEESSSLVDDEKVGKKILREIGKFEPFMKLLVYWKDISLMDLSKKRDYLTNQWFRGKI